MTVANKTILEIKDLDISFRTNAGSIHAIDVQTALECLRLKLRDVKVLGSYPIE